MTATDFLLDEDGDLLITQNDFVLGGSDGQHMEMLFELEPGELKENPMTGIGIQRRLNGSIDGEFRKEVRLQLEADGYEVGILNFLESTIEIDAQRKG